MNKKYLTKTIVYFVLELVVMPMIWAFSGSIVGLFITQSLENIKTVLKVIQYLHIAVAVLSLTFLGLGVYNLITYETYNRTLYGMLKVIIGADMENWPKIAPIKERA